MLFVRDGPELRIAHVFGKVPEFQKLCLILNPMLEEAPFMSTMRGLHKSCDLFFSPGGFHGSIAEWPLSG